MNIDWQRTLTELGLFRVGRVCVILFTADVYIRRFADCTDVMARVHEEDLPYKTFVTLTSHTRVLAINVARVHPPLNADPSGLRTLIETETPSRHVILWLPASFGAHAFRTLCTRFGYCRPPSSLQRMTHVICEGCWITALREDDDDTLPCGHRYCADCAGTKTSCCHDIHLTL